MYFWGAEWLWDRTGQKPQSTVGGAELQLTFNSSTLPAEPSPQS